jgi:hypothetical protein
LSRFETLSLLQERPRVGLLVVGNNLTSHPSWVSLAAAAKICCLEGVASAGLAMLAARMPAVLVIAAVVNRSFVVIMAVLGKCVI